MHPITQRRGQVSFIFYLAANTKRLIVFYLILSTAVCWVWAGGGWGGSNRGKKTYSLFQFLDHLLASLESLGLSLVQTHLQVLQLTFQAFPQLLNLQTRTGKLFHITACCKCIRCYQKFICVKK